MATAYVDYAFYSTTYGGNAIASEDFVSLALSSTAHINRVTFGRAAQVVDDNNDDDKIEQIKLATCAVAEELLKQRNNNGMDGITSERVGSYSVTFGDKSSALMSNEEKILLAARLYLENSGLMFRGFKDAE